MHLVSCFACTARVIVEVSPFNYLQHSINNQLDANPKGAKSYQVAS